MTVWTLREGDIGWVEHESCLQALAMVLDSKRPGRILLTSPRPLQERDDLCAAIEILRGRKPCLAVFVGMPAPTQALVKVLLAKGATEIWQVQIRSGLSRDEYPITPEIGRPLQGPECPALHRMPSAAEEVSVCGRRNDRLILVSRNLRRWCLGEY